MRAILILAALAGSAVADPPARNVRGETITIHEHGPGYKIAQPLRDVRIAPKYSDAAIEQDAWTRAWMLLDIDDRGVVQRVKWIRRPGFDLEKIALDKAFGTRFDPAHDGTGRALSSMLVFPIEWPSYWWIVATEGVVTRIPASAGKIPCRGEGPLDMERIHKTYRDCSTPDLSKLGAEPWVARPR